MEKPQEDTPEHEQAAQRAGESIPPSVLGDVEDAVTPQAEGDLTPWTPPDQPDSDSERED